jgi:hypothetical protein
MVLFELSSSWENGKRPDRLECEGLAIKKNGRVLIFGKSLRRRGPAGASYLNPVSREPGGLTGKPFVWGDGFTPSGDWMSNT